MKKIISLVFLIAILTTSLAVASDFADQKMDSFFTSLQQGNYRQGITQLLTGSALEEKVIRVNQTMNNWVNQFAQIKSLYGDYLEYEKAVTISLGNLEETTYLVYCSSYPIQIVITEYDNGRSTQLINMYFDDESLDTLRQHGRITRF